MNFSHYPVLKVLIPYISGIILGYFLPVSGLNLLFCILGLFIFSIFFILFRRKKHFFLHHTTAILMFLTFCFAGYLSVFFHFHKNKEHLNIEKLTQKQSWIAEIRELPREREKSFKVVAKLNALHDTSYWITKNVVLYFQKDSTIKKCRVGDKLLVNTKLSFIESPKNPYQFDYEKFMKRKGIFLTGYAGIHNWMKLEEKKNLSIKRYTSSLQHFLSEKLIESGLSGAEYGVAAAILLGNDETLEPELRASYAATGVSHILCVSGMHVGIIFMILNFLLLFLGNSTKMLYLRNAILLVSVWLYANITGLAPSVTRAAAMFTFVIIGKFIQRKTSIYHSLFASLFILLSINPLLIFEVGFQLSYLAVFGIVLFQNRIAQFCHPKTKVIQYFWELISVSIAAQIATAPIAICYFGQFPNYFLLTNLFVIPVSFVMTVTGVATLAFSFSDFLSNGLGFLLSFEVKFMNSVVLFIEKLPGALITHISINFIQVILLYFIIITFCVIHKNKKKQLIYCILILLNIFILTHTIEVLKSKFHIEVVRYDIPKSAAFQFCQNGNALIFSDSIPDEYDKRYQYSIQKHDIKMRIKNKFIKLDEDFENSFLCKKGNFIFFRDSIYVLEKNKLKPNTVELVVYDQNFPDGSVHELK